ncbi:MAG TPA: hypothetical protein VFR58_14450 [Flavisolibacter sp.]|nr:hypothetical protein [Flavisolibacter sp.]
MKKLLYILASCWVYMPNAQMVQSPLVALPFLEAYSRNSPSTLAFCVNPAALAAGKGLSASIYGERRFMLPELGSYKAALALGVGQGRFGFTAGRAGDLRYRETAAGLAYARTLGKTDLGLSFDYVHTGALGYEALPAVAAGLGAIFHIKETFRAGLQVANLGPSPAVELPLTMAFGLGYDASERLFAGCEVRKARDSPVDIRLACRYRFHQQAGASLGISTATASFLFGTAVWLPLCRLDVMAALHPRLGISPALMISFQNQRP